MAVNQAISPHSFTQKPRLQNKTFPQLVSELSPDISFQDAAEAYIRARSVNGPRGRYVAKNTIKSYVRHARALGLFFEKTRLKQITLQNLRDYQAARVQGAEPFIRRRRPHEQPAQCPCLPQQVNQELCFLRAMMRRAGCNMEALQHYEELQEQRTDVPRALSLEEQRLWLDVSARRERWQLVHWYSVVAFDTTASTNELRGLRIGDIDLPHRLINIPWAAAKNQYRHRSIALEDSNSTWACERLIERANRMGSHLPQHYLFPFHETRRNLCSPDLPMSESGLKNKWQEVRDATGLKWFRPYDTRHTAITRMAEDGAPTPIIMAKAGHISAKMTAHYTHISIAAQRRWAVNCSREARQLDWYSTRRPAAPATPELPEPTLSKGGNHATAKTQSISTTFTFAGSWFC